ncbi:hypothetical protein ACA910_022222 [Epithemia clementina (nom. ined.)]
MKPTTFPLLVQRMGTTLSRNRRSVSRSSLIASRNLPTAAITTLPTAAALPEVSRMGNRKLSDTPSTASTSTSSSASSTTTKSPTSIGVDGSSSKESSTSRSTRSYSTSTSSTPQQGMQDEYGTMDDSGETYIYDGDFALENGQVLPKAQLRYQTYGELNASRDNAIVVCHALTGNACLHSWWGGLLGPDKAFDTNKYFVVCCNILGSCYGSSGPMSENPATHDIYGIDFPDISVKDTVRLQLLMLQKWLKVRSIKCVIGGSFGGMQVMEFAVQGGSSKYADFVDAQGHPFVRSVIPIACGSRHTAWQIAISETQRQAIYKDPQWSINPVQATGGLEVARQIAMVSYRTHHGYSAKFGRRKQQTKSTEGEAQSSPEYGSNARWQATSYLEYQGQKFLNRFDPVTYVKMTEQMDSHDIARGRAESDEPVLNSIEIPALVMGIDSDVLYPLHEQTHLADHMPNSVLKVIHSDEGHDGFLLEQDQVGGHIVEFLSSHANDAERQIYLKSNL